MKFTLTHVDLDKAVRAYIRGLMTISEDTMITVDVRSSKGETITEVNLFSPDENGNYDIPEAAPAVAKATPAPVADGEAPKRRGRPPKAAPVEEVALAPTSPTTQAEEPADEYEEEPTEESTEEVEETAPVAATPAPAARGLADPVAQSQAPVSAAVPPKRTPLFGARKAG